MSAFVAAIFISRMIQRRKFVTDFTLTIYAVYTLIAWFALGSFPLWTGVWWCVCVVAGACVMWIVMQWYCQRLELQDITLVPLAASSSATTSASAPIQITASSTGSSIVMVAGSNGEHHVRSPPSIFSGGHHHHRTASGVGLLASTATTTTSPQGVCGLNASGVQREPSPTPMVVEMTPNSIKRR
ncbi:golgi integral membrane protein, putative [Bodo saltans]|uniref:Golgi integral membrane protein, putative n=1 Tax=Bodo saltans TaxID=75058 RepID=A0A0S4JDU4_BODSA|nr:golgi integral membrane protein, putative [Bodo saltans]|eukprot:CUG88332.1 golgi integral membrane protein, putative [Bodo saltans]